MPQLQNVVLTDRATTPASHTFTPREITNGVAVVAETSGVPVGENRLSLSFKRTTKLKTRMILVLPTVQTETVNGIGRPKVVREAIANVEFSFSPESTEQERKDLVGMLMSSLDPSKVLINDTVVKAQGIY